MAPHEPPDRHHELICDEIDRIVSGENKRLILMMPPGSAKSTYATVRAPVYYLGKTGRKGIICASHNEDLATSFGRKVRNLVAEAVTQAVFPNLALAEDQRARGEWETKEGGFYYACGVGGSVTGRRGGLLVLDDPTKGREEADNELARKKVWSWYLADFLTRMHLDGSTAVIIILTRWHEDDVAGRILPDDWAGESGDILCKDGEIWRVVCLPAQAGANDPLGRASGEWLWPERTTPEIWEKVRKAQISSPEGVRNWFSLYQQQPTVEEGIHFERKWFDLYRYKERPETLNVYMSGDFALTPEAGDFTELAVWGLDRNDQIYVLDWWSGQSDPMEWAQQWMALVARWKPLWCVAETGPTRRAAEPILTRLMRERQTYTTLEWLPHSEASKTTHAASFRAIASQGMVRFPDTPWAERVISQLLKFPGGRYDDAVDACSVFARKIQATWAALPAAEKPKDLAEVWDAPMRIADFEAPTRSKEW